MALRMAQIRRLNSNYPAGVAVDPNGNLFVADQANNEIRKMTPSGTNWIVTTIAGAGRSSPARDGTNTAQFNNPSGVAVDTNGNVYVADQYNDTIRKLTPLDRVVRHHYRRPNPEPTASTMAPGTNALFNSPFSLTVDGKGSVFVADTGNNMHPHRIPAARHSDPGAALWRQPGPVWLQPHRPNRPVGAVEASSDLLNWLPVWTNTFGPGPLLFTNGFSASAPGLFYRAHLP